MPAKLHDGPIALQSCKNHKRIGKPAQVAAVTGSDVLKSAESQPPAPLDERLAKPARQKNVILNKLLGKFRNTTVGIF
jgi:hypothetical protein